MRLYFSALVSVAVRSAASACPSEKGAHACSLAQGSVVTSSLASALRRAG
jgi:hypothetical protein